MNNPFSKLANAVEPFAWPALRIVAGAMFAFHGEQKLIGWASPHPVAHFPQQMWFGGVIELVAGLLVALGLFTRCAAFVASGTMAVAYFQFHAQWSFEGGAFLPGVNQGELAVFYCFFFLYAFAHGAGRASVDSLRKS